MPGFSYADDLTHRTCVCCAKFVQATATSSEDFRSGAVDPATLNLQALLPALTPGDAGRWNFDAMVGHDRMSFQGMGTPVTIRYVFLSQPASYMKLDQGYGDLNNGFAIFTESQKAITKAVLAELSSVARITFIEDSILALDTKTIAFSKYLFEGSGTAGYAYFPSHAYSWNNTNTVTSVRPGNIAGDVFLNTKSADSYDERNLYNLLTHEVGHALGLSHPFDETTTFAIGAQNTSYTIMAYSDPTNSLFQGRTVDRGLALMDVLALQTLYGANTSHAAGNDTYRFDPVKPVWGVLWDGGGIDTIDLSSFTLANRLDLNGGTFSDIGIRNTEAERRLGTDPDKTWMSASMFTYDGKNNFAIAHNAAIENAKGGTATDILIGNSLNNRLEGNGGNDILIGGLGIDIAGYSGLRSTYGIQFKGSHFIITNQNEFDRLETIEKITFTDGSSIDLLSYFPQFSLVYAARNPDLLRAFDYDAVALINHFINFGRAEGRSISGFSVEAYAARNQDLYEIFGLDTANLIDHYISFGRAEGRVATGFSVEAYAANNPDLYAAFGLNREALVSHFNKFGRFEGRAATGFSVEAYAALNSDLFTAFGLNPNALLTHYAQFGRFEGRAFSGFASGDYAALNPDLFSAIGLEAINLVRHFVTTGRAEGRQTSIEPAPRLSGANLDLLELAFTGPNDQPVFNWNGEDNQPNDARYGLLGTGEWVTSLAIV